MKDILEGTKLYMIVGQLLPEYHQLQIASWLPTNAGASKTFFPSTSLEL